MLSISCSCCTRQAGRDVLEFFFQFITLFSLLIIQQFLHQLRHSNGHYMVTCHDFNLINSKYVLAILTPPQYKIHR